MVRRTGKSSYPVAQVDRRRRAVVLAAIGAVLAALVVGGGMGYAMGRPSAGESGLAEAEASEAARDRSQVGELTALARTTRDRIDPVLAGLVAAAGSKTSASAATVDGWRRTMTASAEPFAEPPSGTTATNVARGGLRAAVESAATAVETYARTLAVPAAQRQPLLDVAKQQAVNAATTWSVAATQLDQINIDAGYGHQHVYLAGNASGAMTADKAPEGGK